MFFVRSLYIIVALCLNVGACRGRRAGRHSLAHHRCGTVVYNCMTRDILAVKYQVTNATWLPCIVCIDLENRMCTLSEINTCAYTYSI